MATGVFYGDTKFDFQSRSTRRMVSSATTPKGGGYVTLTLVSPSNTVTSTLPSNPFKVGDYVSVNNVANFANSDWVTNRYLFQITSTTNSTITYARTLTNGGLTATPGLNAVVEKRLPGLSWGAPIPEARKLSTMFGWNTDLGSTSTMCTMQNRLRDILTKFWSNPEVIRAYNKNYNAYKSSWTTYGPQGGHNVTKFVNATMCIVYGSCRWNKACVGGLDGVCSAASGYTLSQLDSKNLGLWQLNPSNVVGSAAWNIEPSALPGGAGDLDRTWLNAEYSTRAALWVMWRRLFWETSPTVTEDATSGTIIYSSEFTDEQKNPFRWLNKAQWNPSTLKWSDSFVQTCWGSGCSKCPPYGSTTCN